MSPFACFTPLTCAKCVAYSSCAPSRILRVVWVIMWLYELAMGPKSKADTLEQAYLSLGLYLQVHKKQPILQKYKIKKKNSWRSSLCICEIVPVTLLRGISPWFWEKMTMYLIICHALGNLPRRLRSLVMWYLLTHAFIILPGLEIIWPRIGNIDIKRS